MLAFAATSALVRQPLPRPFVFLPSDFPISCLDSGSLSVSRSGSVGLLRDASRLAARRHQQLTPPTSQLTLAQNYQLTALTAASISCGSEP